MDDDVVGSMRWRRCYVRFGRHRCPSVPEPLDEADANREIILLKEIQGLRLEEISRLLALPLGTIKSRSSRARVELATKLRVLDPSYGIG